MYATDYVKNNYTPIPESGCWIWTGNWNQTGYGSVKRRGKWVDAAHRLFYKLHVGPIPDGLFVCHKCDVPACCNPDHLFLGTNSENQIDRHRKGRIKVHGVIPDRTKTAHRVCLSCNTSFMAKPISVRRGKADFCSRACRATDRKEARG